MSDAAAVLGLRGKKAVWKALKRALPEHPLYILRPGGPGRTATGRLREDAVRYVAGLLGQALEDQQEGMGERKAAIQALKGREGLPDANGMERAGLALLRRQP